MRVAKCTVVWCGTLITSTFFLGGKFDLCKNFDLIVAIHSYDIIAQHSSNDTAFQANEKNAASDSSLTDETR
uniref:AlNc14C279G10090 protein n=1 Tax=Albugo laibachii Nc14 TaxID=890382 RepID=F0WUU2_9STRA|nr:AlNc14C279G10090 [Albugo laibachii Nc14]|eukprot:CCA25178.1 AlNc14C279G10090 [Albugo laibachii Nc14]